MAKSILGERYEADLAPSTYSIEIFARELLLEVIEDRLSEFIVLLFREDVVDETTLV